MTGTKKIPNRVKELAVLLVHAVVGWGLCGSLIGIGRALTTMENTLIIHAAGVPVVVALLSFVYYRKFNYTSPAVTAAVFTATPLVLDLAVVAPLVEGSFEMFNSVLGTWIPLTSIFVTAYLVGWLLNRAKQGEAETSEA